MTDILLENPTRKQLYDKICAIAREVDHRKKSNTLGNCFDLAKGLCDEVFGSPEGLYSQCFIRCQVSSTIAVAWHTRSRDRFIVRVVADRKKGSRRGNREVLEGSPKNLVIGPLIDKAHKRRSAVLEKLALGVLGAKHKLKGGASYDSYERFPIDKLSRTWAVTDKAIIVENHGGCVYFLTHGHAVILPPFLRPDSQLWDKLRSSDERVRRCRQWATDAGYIPERPLDDLIDLLAVVEGDEGKRMVVKAIKDLMKTHGVRLEDLE